MDLNGASEVKNNLDLINNELNPSKAEAGKQKLSDDFDNFLLLLTTQLKNQDPTEPLDVNQFTNQLVLFSGVEQQISTNENLEKLIGFQTASQFSSAVDYIGKVVDAKGNAGELVDGIASFSYDLEQKADKVTVVITDGAGRAVFSGMGTQNKGKNLVAWDGKNGFTGAQEPEGTYFVNVLAKDAAGNTITSTTMTTGYVSGAEMRDGKLVLTVAGTYVNIEDVKSVRMPATVIGGSDDDEMEAPDETADSGDDDEVTEDEEV